MTVSFVLSKLYTFICPYNFNFISLPYSIFLLSFTILSYSVCMHMHTYTQMYMHMCNTLCMCMQTFTCTGLHLDICAQVQLFAHLNVHIIHESHNFILISSIFSFLICDRVAKDKRVPNDSVRKACSKNTRYDIFFIIWYCYTECHSYKVYS